MLPSIFLNEYTTELLELPWLYSTTSGNEQNSKQWYSYFRGQLHCQPMVCLTVGGDAVVDKLVNSTAGIKE
jgi:hypothetical protein